MSEKDVELLQIVEAHAEVTLGELSSLTGEELIVLRRRCEHLVDADLLAVQSHGYFRCYAVTDAGRDVINGGA